MAQQVPEGWYADPQDATPGAERWWNGYSWTAHTRRQPPPPPAPESPPAWESAPPPATPTAAYAPAATPAAVPRALADGTPLADLGPRIGAYALDLVLVYAVASVVMGGVRVLVLLLEQLGVPAELWWFAGFPVKALLIALLWVGYQTLTLTRSWPTLGKKWLGMRVRPVDREGPLDSRTAVRRALAGGAGPLVLLFPGSPLLGFGLAGFDAYAMQKDPLRRPWHDQIAGTAVVTTATSRGARA